MSKLKELTWENHKKAERKAIAKKLIKGMEPREYHTFLYNQYVNYAALESVAREAGVLEGIETICRASGFLKDMQELEDTHGIERDAEVLVDVIPEYVDYVTKLDNEGLLAHIYVRHFGELHGGQMIKKRAPGSGTVYDFEDPKKIISDVREKLHDGMAPEANVCFEFAMKMFEQLEA
jgi:heme oxygenase